jgi:hypothetical protein
MVQFFVNNGNKKIMMNQTDLKVIGAGESGGASYGTALYY